MTKESRKLGSHQITITRSIDSTIQISENKTMFRGGLRIEGNAPPDIILGTLLLALQSSANSFLREHSCGESDKCMAFKFAKVISDSCTQIDEEMKTIEAGARNLNL